MGKSRRLFLLLLFIVASTAIFGQFNYMDGWIINSENETIHGFINDGGSMKNAKYCLFKETKESEPIKYEPTAIKAYKLANGKYYVSREIEYKAETKDCFLEVFIEGNVNLYQYGISSVYYIERKGGETIELINKQEQLPDIEDYTTDTRNQYVLVTTVYKDTLYSMFSDCLPIMEDIKYVEYNRKSLVNIINKYLKLTSQDANAVSYRRDLKVSADRFGVYTGIQLSKIMFTDVLVDSRLTPSVPMGIFYNLPLSFLSERLSFQIELLVSRVVYDKPFIKVTDQWEELRIQSTTVGVPVSLIFEFPVNKFTPSIGIGKETGIVAGSHAGYKKWDFNDVNELEYMEIDFLIHKFQKEGWFVDLGLSYEVSPEFSIYSSLRFQRNLNLFMEEENYNNVSFSIAEGYAYSMKFNTYSGALRVGVSF